MKWFQNIETLKDLRKVYRRLVITYHPDNGGSEDVIKEINSEYDILFKRMKNDFEQKDIYKNATDKQKQSYDWQKDTQIREVIMQLAKFKDISVEIIGTWIWISDCYEYRKELKELGFRWAREKKRWYIHFDDYYKFGSKPASMSYIRAKYGSMKVKFNTETDEKKKLAKM
ncbi:MAG: J domain-containing protein [Ruminococcus flavefaciens]|nr:J domain-containing protein [Ruminococcus flavefaciens]